MVKVSFIFPVSRAICKALLQHHLPEEQIFPSIGFLRGLFVTPPITTKLHLQVFELFLNLILISTQVSLLFSRGRACHVVFSPVCCKLPRGRKEADHEFKQTFPRPSRDGKQKTNTQVVLKGFSGWILACPAAVKRPKLLPGEESDREGWEGRKGQPVPALEPCWRAIRSRVPVSTAALRIGLSGSPSRPSFLPPPPPPLFWLRFQSPGDRLARGASMGWIRGPSAWGALALLLLLLCNGAAPRIASRARPRGALAAAAAAARDPAAPFLANVSLERPPERRWEPVLRHFDAAFLREACGRIINETIPEWVHAIIRPIAKELESFAPQPFAGEIRGLCDALGLNVGDGLLLNLAYESTAFCTSIIAQDNNGHIYHGRNMDYAFGDILRQITIEVNFVKNGQVKYRGTTFLGYVGLWTGQSPYKFTISGDERDKGNWWENAVAAFLRHSSPVSWLTRTVLSEAEDFEAAVHMLSKTPIIADVYYIVGGVTPKEGVVITRKRSGPVDIWPLDPLSGGWYRVETNYDHWTTPPPFDDRRTPAIKALNATGQENINLKSLYKVLSVQPVLNKYTIYTTVMSAAAPDQYMTRVRTLE